MSKGVVTIVIPIHKEEPSELEKISLSQTLKILHKYPITFMAPAGLKTVWYENYCQGKAQIFVERFDWNGWAEFAALMIDSSFYQRFLPYEYMLICHMDAFVFRDELEHWCGLGYDYIGAVIYSSHYIKSKNLLRSVIGFTFPEYVGAGGFCLKRNSSFYRITSKYKFYIDFFRWLNKVRNRVFLDDIFLTQHFPKLSSSFKIPSKLLAQQFGADYNNGDEEALPFNNRDNSSMPFGIHSWIQNKQEYWKPVIRRCGYPI